MVTARTHGLLLWHLLADLILLNGLSWSYSGTSTACYVIRTSLVLPLGLDATLRDFFLNLSHLHAHTHTDTRDLACYVNICAAFWDPFWHDSASVSCQGPCTCTLTLGAFRFRSSVLGQRQRATSWDRFLHGFRYLMLRGNEFFLHLNFGKSIDPNYIVRSPAPWQCHLIITSLALAHLSWLRPCPDP